MPTSKKRHKKDGRPGPATKIVVLKVNPITRSIVAIRIKPSTSGVRGVLGMGTLRHLVVLDNVNGEKLVAGLRVGLDPEGGMPEWRLRGTDNFAGVGILFGSRNRSVEFMGNCPADIEWARREIIWCEPGQVAPAAEVAERLGLEATPVGEN